MLKPVLFRKYDIKKIYYYSQFKKIPFKDCFFFQPYYRLALPLKGLNLYVYGGKFWFKVRVMRWNAGLSARYFTWPKRPAIFKK